MHALHPERIVNKTNGVTFRRWLHQANPNLTALLVATCGDDVLDKPEAIAQFETFAHDSGIQDEVASVRHGNKVALERLIRRELGIRVNPSALFDVQIKRIHEYKRQLLNILETVALYDAIRANPGRDWAPRVKIFAGKAAATYAYAKQVIHLAHDVASVVNNDPAVRDLLKVVFLPNYNVSLAERIVPAADLSEQISTAGMEASGTGNMKLSLNGALTIGTLDGANIEIREHVGADNIFIFGLTAQEVQQRTAEGFDPGAQIDASPALRDVLDAIGTGAFSPGERDRYAGLVSSLRHHDRFMLTADFDDYWRAQREVDELWRRRADWWAMSIRNTARMAWFSSDRTIGEYAAEIWDVPANASGTLR